jgi:hypothetical protein
MRDGEHADIVCHQFVKPFEFELTAIIDWRYDQFRPGLLTNQLPGNNILMVFEMRGKDLFASTEL